MEKWWKKIACIWVVLLCLFTISPVMSPAYAADNVRTRAGAEEVIKQQSGSTTSGSQQGGGGGSTSSGSNTLGKFESDGILDDLLNDFKKYSQKAVDENHLLKPAMFLWATLGVIEIVTNFSLYEGQFRLSQLIGTIMKLSFYAFLIINWWNFCEMILQFMLHTTQETSTLQIQFLQMKSLSFSKQRTQSSTFYAGYGIFGKWCY